MKRCFAVAAAVVFALSSATRAADVPEELPGELTADQILNGVYRFPPSPAVESHDDATGFAKEGLTAVPAPGVHPRILLNPDDLPGLRLRLKETEAGRAMLATLRERTGGSIDRAGTWEHELYEKLIAGDTAGALAILEKGNKPSYPEGHYQPEIPYALAMESFDAMVKDDAVQGKRVAAALAGYAAMAEPLLDEVLRQPLADDVWRVKVAGPTTGNWSDPQGLRQLMGYHNLGYAYDFAYNFMDDRQRAQVRRLISKATKGRVWMGASLPHHWRNWNWTMVGMGQPLLALAIEGEEGYDPRVYKLGVQIARDYFTYGISPSGCSTEAVGYTQFGFVWANPFIVAAARRGDNLLVNSHLRGMIDWYLQSMDPAGGVWQSHGDGGDSGPAIWTMAMWRYFYPDDPKVDFLWQNLAKSLNGKPYEGRYHIIEPLIWAADGKTDAAGKPVDYAGGSKLNLPVTWFDPVRSSLAARSGWDADATAVEFECRTDSVDASHEHADRGNFTLSALGRQWARESFRSVETRHHNCVLIDGMGQGFWPGPGKWLGMKDGGWAVSAACDAKAAYDWWWPKEITTEDPATFLRYRFPRWESYLAESLRFHKEYAGLKLERDDRPSVVKHFTGFEAGDPRMWDEDAWPVRLPHNPVEKAFRTLTLVRDGRPYVVVADDIQKDAKEHLYEWLMMTGPNTEMASIAGHDIELCDATVARDANGLPKPKKGDRELLVRVLEMADPAAGHDYQARPSARLEAFEKVDTLAPGGRTFGLDKRLVIASRSVAPRFKILLFPHRAGDELPVTTWDAGRTAVTLEVGDQKDVIRFKVGEDGRTRVVAGREGKEEVAVP